jgi:cytochrome c biogenesis protein CcmG/thiol:disulfide interchange protein DsbE
VAFRGRPVVVNFWASWCIPCRNEFPLFRDELALHHADGLALVGVVFKDDDAAARGFLDKFGATWPSLTDADGAHASDWRVIAPPQTYFIGRDGLIRSRQIGEVTKVDFERQLAAILK